MKSGSGAEGFDFKNAEAQTGRARLQWATT